MRKSHALAVGLALLFVLGGCLDGAAMGSTSLTAAQIQERSLERINETTAFAYTTERTISAEGGHIRTVSEGVIETEARRMRANVSTTIDTGDHSSSIDGQLYVVDGTQYVTLASTDQWQTTPVSADRWNSTPLDQQRSLVQAVNLTKNGTATVEGVETHVLSYDVTDTEAFKRAMIQQATQNESTQGGAAIANATIESYEGHLYVGTESNVLRKMTTNATITRDGERMTFNQTMSLEAVDEVSVDLPEGAQAATK